MKNIFMINKIPQDQASWWMYLASIPESVSTEEYKRIRRCWNDSTRFNASGHEFQQVTENHLTWSSFENFSLFRPEDYLSDFLSALGVQLIPPIKAHRFSYEVESLGSRGMPDEIGRAHV